MTLVPDASGAGEDEYALIGVGTQGRGGCGQRIKRIGKGTRTIRAERGIGEPDYGAGNIHGYGCGRTAHRRQGIAVVANCVAEGDVAGGAGRRVEIERTGGCSERHCTACGRGCTHYSDAEDRGEAGITGVRIGSSDQQSASRGDGDFMLACAV